MFDPDDPEMKQIMEETNNGMAVKSFNAEADTPNVFSFRAECPYDVAAFVNKLVAKRINLKIEHTMLSFGEVSTELYTDADLETLIDVMCSGDDTHVMVQTLRPVPLKENSLERDRSNNA